MKWLLGCLIAIALVSNAHSQGFLQQTIDPLPGVTATSEPAVVFEESGQAVSGPLAGNRSFPNFIGFMSNPIQSIDPRAVTEIYPIFGAGWVSGSKAILPSGDVQLYGAGISVALTDRLSIGLNQGGYGVANFSSSKERILQSLGLPVPEIARSRDRAGWMNLGGFAQYTLIADVPNQFLLTAGVRWEAPTGANQMFQGSGPAYLSPYVTVGKELGLFHILATTGYEFPAGSGSSTTETYYFNLHIDRKIGRIYPLAEFNYAHRTFSKDVSIDTPHHGVIDLGTFTTSGDMLTGAFGANVIIVPTKLEIGAVYIRPLTQLDRFDVNSMLVKLVYRY